MEWHSDKHADFFREKDGKGWRREREIGSESR